MAMKLPRCAVSPSRFVCLGLVLLFAAANSAMVIAQSSNAPVAPPSGLPESMQYPTNQAQLPGKGPIPSWKPFPRIWAQRRAEFMRHHDQDKGAVVFLGDSITQGWN